MDYQPQLELIPLSEWLPVSARPLVISGPCSAESREQLMATASLLKQTGKVSVFRAGIWKPRTRPGSFQGVGEEGLVWLSEIRQRFGFPVAVEIATPAHVELALKYDVDILWIGARTVVNPFSMDELTAVLKELDKPVMVKNPVHPDLSLWIGALERLNRSGIRKLAAIHRGFSPCFRSQYRNEPMWEIPIELKRLCPGLPVITDPSHIAGNRNLLPEICQRSLDLLMDGLMIETHYRPEEALTDQNQQITPEQLVQLLNQLVVRSEFPDSQPSVELEHWRREIDVIDYELLRILARRMEIIARIGDYKKNHRMTILQLRRWSQLLEDRLHKGLELGLDREFLHRLLTLVHQESIRLQNDIMNTRSADDLSSESDSGL